MPWRLNRQFKEQQQLRQRNHEANEQNGSGGHSGGHHYQQPRLTASALARMQQLQGAEPSALPTTTTRSLYDVKAMQKEAVLSYVKVLVTMGVKSCLKSHFNYCTLGTPPSRVPRHFACLACFCDLYRLKNL